MALQNENRPLRADARRNREAILVAARELFGEQGSTAQMDDVAARAGVGVGTVYRHFPTKQALLTGLVRARFASFADDAREALKIEDPWDAFEGMLRANLAGMQHDAAARDAMLHFDELDWEGIEADKAELMALSQQLIDSAIAAGRLRADFTAQDIGPLMCGVSASMHFMDAGLWQRHFEIILDGLRAR